MPSRCALPRTAIGVRPSLSEITPVGVLPRASFFNSFTSRDDQLLLWLRLYFGLALRGPLRPIGEPGRFHDALREFRRAMIGILKLLQVLLANRKASTWANAEILSELHYVERPQLAAAQGV